MNERRRLLTEYIRDDADEELDYFTVIPVGINGEERCTLFLQGYSVEIDDGRTSSSDLYYSVNGGEWINSNNNPFEVNTMDRVRLKSEGYDTAKMAAENMEHVTVFITASVDLATDSGCLYMVEGTPLSLLHGDNFKERKNNLTYGCFYGMFNLKPLVQINNPKTFLPSTELAPYCYQAMFSECSVLNCPELPAETLAVGCYSSMFYKCVYIENAPELNARTLAPYCYQAMFYYCASLSYIKFIVKEGFDVEGATDYMLSDICPYGVMVASNEMIELGLTLSNSWFIVPEDYPTDNNGFPSTEVLDDSTRAVCVNTEFVKQLEGYETYRRREADSFSKMLYDTLWREEDVGIGADLVNSGFYVDRKLILYSYTGEDFVEMTTTIPSVGNMIVTLWSDGLIECKRNDLTIRL